MKDFEYFAPTSVEEAVALLGRYGREARVLAGGTDLLVRMKLGHWNPRYIVNIKRIPGLREIVHEVGTGLRIGALSTLTDLINSPEVEAVCPVVAQAARTMAGVQIRNLATVGGNLCNAAPSADLAPPLIALDAQAYLVGQGGERIVPLGDFFSGPGHTVLAEDEILTAVVVPRPSSHTRATYLKLEHRQAMDIAVAGVAVALTTRHTLCDDVRIVLGAVAPTPMRAKRAEAVLRGQTITEERIEEAGRVAAEESKPIDDVRASAWYRREIVKVLTRRGIRKLWGQESDETPD